MKRISAEAMTERLLGTSYGAKNIMDILSDAKSRVFDNEELEQRYWDAIQAIGLAWLEKVEGMYEPEKKKYRIHIEGSRSVEVEATDESEALELVESSDESAREWEVYGATEEVKDV